MCAYKKTAFRSNCSCLFALECTTMSSILTYIVLGVASSLVAEATANSIPIRFLANTTIVGPFQHQIVRYDYTYTEGVGAHRLSTGRSSWNMGRRNCEQEGGHLAIINSVAEAEVVTRLMNISNIHQAYIGVHDLYQEGDFVTIHGESLTQTGFGKWDSGEPNNGGNLEHCVELKLSGKMNDVPCSILIHYICELRYVQSYVIQVPARPEPAVVASEHEVLEIA